VADEHHEVNKAESAPKPQHTFDYPNTFDQFLCQPQTSAQFGTFYSYAQPNDMLTAILNTNTSSNCFCPTDSCNCPGQQGLVQYQQQQQQQVWYLAPPPAFQLFKAQTQPQTPLKIPQRTVMVEDWDCDWEEFPMDAELGTDNFRLNFALED
jgi:hypothetical protein